jgi:hypothetical protein
MGTRYASVHIAVMIFTEDKLPLLTMYIFNETVIYSSNVKVIAISEIHKESVRFFGICEQNHSIIETYG